jgi:predicted DNA-binding protein
LRAKEEVALMKKAQNKRRRTKQGSPKETNTRDAIKEYCEQHEDIQLAVDAMRQVRLIQEARTKNLLDHLVYIAAEI